MRRREFMAAAMAGTAAAQTGGAKKLIVHADDAGMCHSVNVATMEAMTKGSVSSCSVMMPCSWVQEFADWAKANPGKDIGLHLTLTSEWKYYRWRPVASIERVKGLIDKEGYIWRDVRGTAMSASAAEVEAELRAQITRAKEYGIQFTHLDSHMGTLFARPDYFDVYTKLGQEFGVPCMLPKANEANAGDLKGYPITPEMLKKKEAGGMKMLDRLVTGVPGRTVAERRESYRKFIAEVKPGVTKLIIHLAKEDAEIKAVTNSWEYRWADFVFWSGDEAKELLARHGVELYTYRQLAG